MIRQIIEIDEDKCTGCGLCVPNCHEGALQIIDNKARLISDLFCDGLGACIGHCPEGAITIVEREAEPYDEIKVMEIMVTKGRNTVLAHLKHLKDHNETELLNQAIRFLKDNQIDMSPDSEKNNPSPSNAQFSNKQEMFAHRHNDGAACGCAGSRTMDFRIDMDQVESAAASASAATPAPSELRQWPVQMHLVNPAASYFRNADVVLAADCVPFAMGDFHETILKGKSLAIACPKLDHDKEIYLQKLVSMINDARINTLTVPIMEVPCCGGLLQLAKAAVQQSGRNIPVKKIVIGVQGSILQEEWV